MVNQAAIRIDLRGVGESWIVIQEELGELGKAITIMILEKRIVREIEWCDPGKVGVVGVGRDIENIGESFRIRKRRE